MVSQDFQILTSGDHRWYLTSTNYNYEKYPSFLPVNILFNRFPNLTSCDLRWPLIPTKSNRLLHDTDIYSLSTRSVILPSLRYSVTNDTSWVRPLMTIDDLWPPPKATWFFLFIWSSFVQSMEIVRVSLFLRISFTSSMSQTCAHMHTHIHMCTNHNALGIPFFSTEIKNSF